MIVHVNVLSLVDWFLDVPEYVVRHRLEYLMGKWSSKTILVGFLEILNVVVFLASFENRELLIQICVPLINWEIVNILHLLHESDSQIVIIFFEGAVNRLLIAEQLELSTEFGLVHLMSELLILQGVDECAIFIFLSTSHWVEDALGQRAYLILAFGSGNNWFWLVSLIGGKLLLVVVECYVLIL